MRNKNIGGERLSHMVGARSKHVRCVK